MDDLFPLTEIKQEEINFELTETEEVCLPEESLNELNEKNNYLLNEKGSQEENCLLSNINKNRPNVGVKRNSNEILTDDLMGIVKKEDEEEEINVMEFVCVKVEQEVVECNEHFDHESDPLATTSAIEIKVEPLLIEEGEEERYNTMIDTSAANISDDVHHPRKNTASNHPALNQDQERSKSISPSTSVPSFTCTSEECPNSGAVSSSKYPSSAKHKNMSNQQKLCVTSDLLTSNQTNTGDEHDEGTKTAQQSCPMIRRKKFKCMICTYCTNSLASLTNHMKQHVEGKLVKCTICDFVAIHLSKLKVHMRVHTGEKPYKCTVCDYTARQSHQLTMHMRIHTGEKPFKCTVCDFSAIRSSTLKLHMREHTGEKPYMCAVCGYCAASSNQIKLHKKEHIGQKPYKCTACDYSATFLSKLKEHMKVHTEEKSYKCTVCSYSTAYSCTLKRHMRVHTREKPYKCTVCDYSAANSYNLKKHIESAHKRETL